MILPPGTLKALKGHPDAVVCVVVVFLALAAIALKAPPIPVVVLAFLAFGWHHVRSQSTERHQQAMMSLKIDETLAKADLVKARHRDLLELGQISLELGVPAPRSPTRGGRR